MLKQIMLSLALVASSIPVLAEPVVVPSEALKAIPQLAAKCQPHCLIMNPEDFAALKEQVQAMVSQAYAEGQKAGVRKERGSI